jgi:hypothetical protein
MSYGKKQIRKNGFKKWAYNIEFKTNILDTKEITSNALFEVN